MILFEFLSEYVWSKTDLRFFQKMVSESERRLSYWFISDLDRKNTEKELKQLRRLVTYTENYISKLKSEKIPDVGQGILRLYL